MCVFLRSANYLSLLSCFPQESLHLITFLMRDSNSKSIFHLCDTSFPKEYLTMFCEADVINPIVVAHEAMF